MLVHCNRSQLTSQSVKYKIIHGRKNVVYLIYTKQIKWFIEGLRGMKKEKQVR